MNEKPRLTQILEDMLSQSMQRQGTPYKRNLKSGLALTVRASISGVTLIMQRADSLPTNTEIRTILKYFPYRTGEVPVTEFHYDGKLALRLDIKAPQEIAKFL